MEKDEKRKLIDIAVSRPITSCKLAYLSNVSCERERHWAQYAPITKYTRNKGRLFAAFIDFRKAYDTVNRDKMLETLKEYGITGRLWNNMQSIYKSVQYTIKINNKAMNPISSKPGT